MKKLIVAVLILVIVFSVSVFAQDSDEQTIRDAVIKYYVGALKTRDFRLMRKICVPEARLMGANGEGRLRSITLDQWSKNFIPGKPRFKSLEYQITKVEIVREIAQVRIDFVVDGESKITDFLHMARLKGKWRVLNIIDD